MATPFDMVITQLQGLGFFEFLLPFIISAAIFYGLLRKSKIFGEPDRNVGVNAVIALGAAFMVWASPIIIGIDITKDLATFFLQGVSTMLIFSIAAMIATMFFGEDIAKQIKDRIGGQSIWWVILVAALLIGGAMLFTSGLYKIFAPQGFAGLGISADIGSIVLTIAVLAIFLVVIVFIAK